MSKRSVIALLALLALTFAGASLAKAPTSSAPVTVDASSFEVLELLGFQTPEWITGAPRTNLGTCEYCYQICGETGGVCVGYPDWCICF